MKFKAFFFSMVLATWGGVSARTEIVNVAKRGVPYAAGALYGGASINALVNGDKQSVFHGDVGLPDGFAYTLNLGENYSIRELKIYPRQDDCCADRLTNFRVSIHGATDTGELGPEVWGQNLFTDGTNPGSAAGSLVTIVPPAPQTGQWIQVQALSSPVPDYHLQMTELEVLAEVPESNINRAIGAQTSANQGLWPGTSTANLVNGSRYDFVHGVELLQPGFAYTINLGTEVDMNKVLIFSREGCCPERLSNYRVSIYKDANGTLGEKVWSADLHGDGSNPGSDPGSQDLLTASLNAAGQFKGQYIVIEALDDPVPSYFLQIAEVEVYGTLAAGTKLLLAQEPADTAVGSGGTATFSAVVTVINGDTNLLTFQWQKNGVNITDGTNSVYTAPLVLSADSGAKYKVIASYPGQPSLASREATLRINFAFQAAAFANQILYPGGGTSIGQLVNGNRNASFHGDVGIQPGFAYQARLGGPVKFDSIDIYPRQDGCCAERLSNFRVSIHDDNAGQIGPAVWSADLFTDGSNPGSGPGTLVHLTAGLNAGGKFEGQWIQILSLDEAPADYILQMTELEAFGTPVSDQAVVTIVSFPSGVVGAPGRTSAITVSANVFNGDPSLLTYQWKKNGGLIVGATNVIYLAGPLADSDAGAKYSVVVSYPGVANIESAEAVVSFDYNYARGATAFTSQPLWIPGNWNIGMLVDGDKNGVFHGHTTITPGFAYTVNLGDPVTLEKINIYPRQDTCCSTRLTNFRVSVHNDNNGQIGASVWSVDLFTDGSNPDSGAGSVLEILASLHPEGVFKGQWIKIESLENPVQDYALQMTELEAFGRIQPALRIALTGTAAAPQLTWPEGTLESTEALGGTWATVTGAASPYAIQKSSPARFYRLRR